VHRDGKVTQLATIGFGQRLQAEADAKNRQVFRTRRLDRRLAVEVFGVAGVRTVETVAPVWRK
jgi:hypothetical protein